jgi:hypothetical protein
MTTWPWSRQSSALDTQCLSRSCIQVTHVQASLAESGARSPESPHPRNTKTTPDAGLWTPCFTAGDSSTPYVTTEGITKQALERYVDNVFFTQPSHGTIESIFSPNGVESSLVRRVSS